MKTDEMGNIMLNCQSMSCYFVSFARLCRTINDKQAMMRVLSCAFIIDRQQRRAAVFRLDKIECSGEDSSRREEEEPKMLNYKWRGKTHHHRQNNSSITFLILKDRDKIPNDTKLLGLIGHTKDALLDVLEVADIVSSERTDGILVRNWLQVLIQLIDQGYSSGDVQGRNLLVGDVVQVLDERTKGITMSGDDDSLARLDARSNVAVPEGQHAIQSGLQALCDDGMGLRVVLILGVVLRQHGGCRIARRRRNVIGASPNGHLLLAILGYSLLLVHALESAVVSIRQAGDTVRTIHCNFNSSFQRDLVMERAKTRDI